MSVVSTVLPRQNKTFLFTRHLGFLALFGILHGTVEFIEMQRLNNPAEWLALLSRLLLLVSCINTTGAWEGEIWNRRKNGEVYPEHLTITAVIVADGMVTHYVATLIDITLSKAAVNEIERLAYYDFLTGLPNRQLLWDRLKLGLASSHRNGRKGALLFIDMDNFKTLNDTFGHDMGDLLLQQVAQRLEFCIREGDTVARLGGEEFVVMLEDLSVQALEAAEQTESIGNKILAALNQPYRLDIANRAMGFGNGLRPDQNLGRPCAYTAFASCCQCQRTTVPSN
ncbi:MAG: sensor domain-containing diguanylate cyclase [Methylococcales bacterium]|nr:sensor domain-containing diguanylate cyclase [Methylococcales bacterium]